MDINKMTRKDFEAVPRRSWGEDIGEFDTLVILPTRKIHDSGYRAMEFVAVRDDEPLRRLGGYSDVLHIDGIGGYGQDWLKKWGTVPHVIPPVGWSIDCLPKSGLLRLFCHRPLTCGNDLSSFEVFSGPPKVAKKEASTEEDEVDTLL